MDIFGRVGIWPVGSNFVDNQLCQIYVRINEKEFIFNNYVSEKEKKELEELLAPMMVHIQVSKKGAWDNRKKAIEELNKYASNRGITPYRTYQLQT